MTNRVVSVVLRGEVSGFVGSMKTAAGSVQDVTGRMTGASKEAALYRQNLSTLGAAAGKMGLAVTAGVGLAVKAAMDWESAWAGVTKTIDGTPAQLSKIEQGLRDMSSVKPTSAIELAAIAESAGALGVKTDDILSFTSVMADLGQATNLTSDEASTSIAQLMNIMQTAPEDVNRLGATLVDLGNKGASTERQIVQMAQNIAGAGAIIGLSEANVLALGNALASSGIEAEAGGSAISNVLMDIEMSVQSGNDSIQQWADVAGMSADKFAAAWKADPADALASFVEGLGRMNQAGGDVFSTLSNLGQSDIRVTRALLNMAASGDMLRTSLQNGDVAWEKSSALAIETAKRYDTTASQVKMSWNEITSAAVNAGNSFLPAVASIASAVGNVGGAFNKLPSEAQGGVAAFATVSGAGLLAIGGISKLTTSIAANRAAMDSLKTSSPQAAGALGKLSKAATVATVALGAYYAINKSQGGGDKVAGVEKFTRQFLDIAKGSDKAKKSLNDLANIKADQDILHRVLGIGGSGKSGADIKGLKDLFDSASRNAIQNIGNKITPYDDSYDTAQKGIKQIDAALTQMVTSGAVDQAAAGFKYLREETGKSADDLKKVLPSYSEAIQGAANQEDLAAIASKKLAKAKGDVGDSAKLTKQLSEDEAKALAKAEEATMQAAAAFDAFGDNLDPKKMGFGEYIKSLEEMAQAQADWADNLIVATARGVDEGVISKFEQMGPEGAKRLAELANATDTEIDRVNKAFESTVATGSKLAVALNEIPPEAITEFKTAGAPGAIQTAVRVASKYDELDAATVTTVLEALDYSTADIKAVLARMAELDAAKAKPEVEVETDPAKAAIDGIQRWIDNIRGKTVEIHTKRTGADAGSSSGGTGPTKRAIGGAIAGPGSGTSDEIPAWLSNGEHVLTAAEVAKAGGQAAIYRMRAAIRSGNMPAFASGGAVSSRYDNYSALSQSSKLDLARQQQRIKDIEKSLSEKETYGKGKNKKTRLALRGLDRTVAQLELKEARAELSKMKRENVQLKGYGTKEQEEARRDAEEAAVQAAEDIVKEAASKWSGAKESATSKFGLGAATSAAAVDRNLGRLLADSATFLGLLGDLKAKGASPWLLAQLVEAGPTKGAIKLARQYNTDQAALDSINSRAAQIDAYSNQYANLVGNAAFAQAGAWSSGVSSASMAPTVAGAQVAINVQPSAGMSETNIAQAVAGQLMWRLN